MRVHAINLDRDTDRWAQFQTRNAGLVDVERFPAVEGSAVDRSALTADGSIVEPLNRNAGALGCACSHIALWRRAVESDETLTIVEDDTVLAGNFADEAARVLGELSAGWDVVMWGWNFDMPLWAAIPDRVSVCRMDFDQNQMREHLGAFRAGRQPRTAIRLRHCFGTHAYSVTPTGARALLRACLPMTDRLVSFNEADLVLANSNHDTDMNRAYPALRAYACLPPLALSENRHEASHTVHRAG